MNISLQAMGDEALKVTFLEEVSPALNREIQFFCQKLQEANINGLVEWVPAFNAVTIYYEPYSVSYQELYDIIFVLHQRTVKRDHAPNRRFDIPVVYGGKDGPDLKRVAEHNQLSVERVIELHQNGEYLVYMLGFLPGFPYLGGLDRTIATPRLETPRTKTFAGSVGIAHEQTGIYPVESPGGWNIIGKTPVQLFDLHHETSAFLFRAGDRVHFHSITESEYERITAQIKTKEYQVNVKEGDESW